MVLFVQSVMDMVWQVPNYDFKCNKCGGVQEIHRSYGDSTDPACCGETMIRLWSSTPVHFKGSGFYKTDNKG